MNVLFDSNTLVALFVKNHIDHGSAYDAYLNHQNDRLFIATHSIAEIYRTLTWGVEYLNFTAEQAHHIISNSLLSVFNVVDLEREDYQTVLNFMKEEKLTGPIIYDALIARASEKVKADQLITFNNRDFERIQKLTSANLIVL